jgi:hypothetical protein
VDPGVFVFGKDKARAEPFETVEIDLSLIWGELPPEPEEDEPA